jgi:hypothetical protein
MQQHRQLLDLIEAALSTPTPVTTAPIARQRVRPMPAGVAQMVSLRIVRSRAEPLFLGDAEPGAAGPLQWQSSVGIECVARATGNTDPDEAVADLLASVHARITGDAVLRASPYQVHPAFSLEWDQDELDERLGAVTCLYTVRHLGALTSIATA